MQRLKLRHLYRRLRHDERGATSVFVAISMVVVLAMSALVVDIGANQTKKAQLQDAADAAAIAIAQECVAAAGTMLTACDGTVQSRALATAASFTNSTLNDGAGTVTGATFTANTVTVSVSDVQQGVFSAIFGSNSTTMTAKATAEWEEAGMVLPLAYNECSFPVPSETNRILLRYDLVGGLDFSGCGLVTDILAPGWITTPFARCEFDVRLLTFVSGVLTKLLFPASCTSKLATLEGKVVLLPVYDGLLTDVVVDGVLLHRYEIEKYALFEVTGWDFSPLTLFTGQFVNYDPAAPGCGSLLVLSLCEGIQGVFHGFVTPTEASEMVTGVKLIE